MILNAASPRTSFSIPISINLQGARRRQTREVVHAGAAQDQEWSRGLEGPGQQRARAQASGMSVGEDRAMLLGFAMIALSVLMFCVIGITVVKPYINSNWEEETSCALVQTDVLQDWVDCRGVSTVPCLRATVNLTDTNQSALLHLDEESVLLAPECFYVPNCHMDRADVQDEVQKVKELLDGQLGNSSSCFADRTRHPNDVILGRKHTLRGSLYSLLWPSLMLGGGALLVGLVRLTQCLARLSSEMCRDAAGTRLTSRYSQGKLYRLLRSMQASS